MILNSELKLEMKLRLQLRALIKQRGVAITTLAKTTKIPAQTIHNWIAGSKPRDLDQVKRVADYFHVSLDYLVYSIQLEQASGSEIEKHKDEINAGILRLIKYKPSQGKVGCMIIDQQKFKNLIENDRQKSILSISIKACLWC